MIIWIRNADPHLVYDCVSKKRINFTKSIFIGDHVWIGQGALILKGTKIHSGSIIGAMSCVAGKTILSNTSWCGNPGRQVKKDIFWECSCVHKWTSNQTKERMYYKKDDYIFNYDRGKGISFEKVDEELSKDVRVNEKYEYLVKLSRNNEKNRFSCSEVKEKKKNILTRIKKKIKKILGR